MTDSQRTKTLFEHVTKDKPVTVMGKLPTADDVRAVIATTFKNADELWKATALKKVTSRAMVKYSTPQKRRETSNMLTVDQVNTNDKL